MYTYHFAIKVSNQKCGLLFTNYRTLIEEAIDNVNHGMTYLRDSKTLTLDNVAPTELHVTLSCSRPLNNASRSLSALSRELLRNHGNIFEAAVYNKTLFSIKMISQNNPMDIDNAAISNTELLKTIVDLLFAHTSTTKKEQSEVEATINHIKELVKPYMRIKQQRQ